MQIPILSGIYRDNDPDLRNAYPVNMEPIAKASGVSQGYLRVAQGLKLMGETSGVCRGGIEWNGVCYRVMGTKFGSVSGAVFTEIGDVGGAGPVTMDYGFDYLAIASNGKLYLFDGTSLTQNTDPDLGEVLDVAWIDGYFITTDGEFLVSTELGDPFSVSPFKYGSSEEDADPVVAVKKLGTELYAINRHTIEAFSNTGGTNFPFDVIDGTQGYRGAVGTHAVTQFLGGLAFVGGARNEPAGVFLGANGSSQALSTPEIETILEAYTEADLAQTVCETRRTEGRELLYVHLPNQTLVYDGTSTQLLGQPVWFVLKGEEGAYRGRYFVWCAGSWAVADPVTGKFGEVSSETAAQWGDPITWEFSTPFLFGDAKGIVCHELELTGLTGVTLAETGAVVGMQFTEDGVVRSQRYPITLGQRGNRSTPLKWTRVGFFEDTVSFVFSGDSNARFAAARLDATIEASQW